MAADVGTLQRIPRLIPEGVVRELAYTGRRFFADEAKAHGLVNKVFDSHEEMMSAVKKLLRKKLPPKVLWLLQERKKFLIMDEIIQLKNLSIMLLYGMLQWGLAMRCL